MHNSNKPSANIIFGDIVIEEKRAILEFVDGKKSYEYKMSNGF
jgi:hypothetical protein